MIIFYALSSRRRGRKCGYYPKGNYGQPDTILSPMCRGRLSVKWLGPRAGTSSRPECWQGVVSWTFRPPRFRAVAQCSALPTSIPMKTSMSSISISPAASRCVGARPAGGQAGPVPRPAKDLTHSGPFPISGVTSARLPQVTFAPPDHLRTGAGHPCPQQLAQPRTIRDHQQGDEQATWMLSPVVLACLKSNSG